MPRGGNGYPPPSILSVTTRFNHESQQQVGDSCPVSELQHFTASPGERAGERGERGEPDAACSQSEYITKHKTLIQSGSKKQHERGKINSSVPQSKQEFSQFYFESKSSEAFKAVLQIYTEISFSPPQRPSVQTNSAIKLICTCRHKFSRSFLSSANEGLIKSEQTLKVIQVLKFCSSLYVF